MATNGASQLSSAGFRKYLPDLNSPRFTIAKEQSAYEYAEAFQSKQNPPWLYNLTKAWEKLHQEPYKGITNDGVLIPNVFPVVDESIPISAITQSAKQLLALLTPDLRAQLSQPISSQTWRAWSNPEILLRPLGIRLEELPLKATHAILHILETTLSPAGYAKALAAMRINHYLGELVQLPRIMNQYSYNFLLLGTPSTTESWGFLLYGHHLCLSVFLRGKQIVIAPTFTGAEPNMIDSGPWTGISILHREGDIGLALMQSLTPAQQRRAQIYEQLRDPKMVQTGDLVTDRWNKDDQRHLCGAFRDNRVVPYEGVLVSEMTDKQRDLVMDIAEEFLLYHPHRSREIKKDLMKGHLNTTYFCWIGGYGDADAFYYRIQSPVIILEFDHHSGVFLTNDEPAKFHTHTIVRFPNQGDYGNVLREDKEKL